MILLKRIFVFYVRNWIVEYVSIAEMEICKAESSCCTNLQLSEEDGWQQFGGILVIFHAFIGNPDLVKRLHIILEFLFPIIPKVRPPLRDFANPSDARKRTYDEIRKLSVLPLEPFFFLFPQLGFEPLITFRMSRMASTPKSSR